MCPGLGVQKPNGGIPRINRINALWHLLLKNILSCSSQHVDVKWRIQLHTKHISKKNIQQPINGIYIYWMKVFTTNSGIPLLWAACDRLLQQCSDCHSIQCIKTQSPRFLQLNDFYNKFTARSRGSIYLKPKLTYISRETVPFLNQMNKPYVTHWK